MVKRNNHSGAGWNRAEIQVMLSLSQLCGGLRDDAILNQVCLGGLPRLSEKRSREADRRRRVRDDNH